MPTSGTPPPPLSSDAPDGDDYTFAHQKAPLRGFWKPGPALDVQVDALRVRLNEQNMAMLQAVQALSLTIKSLEQQISDLKAMTSDLHARLHNMDGRVVTEAVQFAHLIDANG